MGCTVGTGCFSISGELGPGGAGVVRGPAALLVVLLEE